MKNLDLVIRKKIEIRCSDESAQCILTCFQRGYGVGFFMTESATIQGLVIQQCRIGVELYQGIVMLLY